MRTSLADLLALDRPLLADGATGTNYFGMGLGPGEPPEFWNLDRPDQVRQLHQEFVDAGADIILTNTFGSNRYRLALHNAGDRAGEIARIAAEIAGDVAASSARPVVVAGSVGPTGELLVPLGTMTEDDAIAAFTEQTIGLRDGGVDVIWIETKSAAVEMRAAALAAIAVGMPYTVTASFDTAGRTMMGLRPAELVGVFDGLSQQPVAIGANCGVGASDLLLTVQQMRRDDLIVIAKSNCGVPQFRGAEIEYSGNPTLMGEYATLAVDSGATIVGGCCGTSPAHLAEMRRTLDGYVRRDAPTLDQIVATVGPLTNSVVTEHEPATSRRRRRRD
ncbi:MAG: betaine--homocysteine S-methyltransferase [Ilumatobacteraceae bacterium]